MKEKIAKILGTLLFVLLILLLTYLIFFTTKNSGRKNIKEIEVTGNNLLSANEYLVYSRLNEKSSYKDLTLPVIKSRIEKHHYILKADVKYGEPNKINISIREKNIKGLILNGRGPYLITAQFEILPLLPNTKFLDIPVISNPFSIQETTPGMVYKTDDIIQAFKIIEAAELTNEKLPQLISEINLRNGKDVVVTLSGLEPTIIFGKKDEARKMVYLDKVLELFKQGSDITEGSGYLDLRFQNQIFLGGYKNTGFAE
jgi:cell division protein FtsQ